MFRRTSLLRIVNQGIFLSILLPIFLTPSQAQLNEVQFDHLSVSQGLSNNTVFAILQDRQGFMWFGTRDGLNRFDGYSYKVYKHDPRNSKSLNNNGILTLYEDNSGTLWIGTSGGLDKFDRTTESFTLYQEEPRNAKSLSNNEVRAIYGDKAGNLWVGGSNGLNKLDRTTGEFARYQYDPQNSNSLSYHFVSAICEDTMGVEEDKNVLWIGTGNVAGGGGLNKFQPSTGRFTHYRHDPKNPNSLSNDIVWTLHIDRSGVLWVGTNSGLDKFDRATRSFLHYRFSPESHEGLRSNYIQSICEDRTGALWITTWAGGLSKFDKMTGRFTNYKPDEQNPKSLSNINVMSSYEDKSGILWFGTWERGVNTYDRRLCRFVHFARKKHNGGDMMSNDVHSIYEDKSATLWVGTRAGLNKLALADGGTTWAVTRYTSNQYPMSPGYNTVFSIFQDPDELGSTLWIGTYGGLNKFDRVTGKFTMYSYVPRKPNDVWSPAFQILPDGRSALWITGDGLNRFDRHTRRYTRFLHDPQNAKSLSNNSVGAMFQDGTGVLWVGSVDGLDGFDCTTESFVHYKHDPDNPRTLSDNHVTSIYGSRLDSSLELGRDSLLWIGTTDGLNAFDRTTGTFTPFTEKDGLSNTAIKAIMRDGKGNLWISTNRGLSKFSPRTRSFKNYDASDGLLIAAFNERSSFQNRSGEMYFGGVNGFVRFHPDSIKDNPNVPPVVITAFKKFDKLVQLDSSISNKRILSLDHNDNVISFEFASLSYTSPEKNQYAYKLEGFDPDWVYCGTRRYAIYTNLDGGKYTFRVKGSNNDGVWNETGTSIAVIVTPPFWKTWWFITFIWLSIAGTGAGTVRYVEITKLRRKMRVLEQQQALEKERLRISSDLHDELASNLTSIAMLSKILQDDERRGEATMQRKPQLLERITTLSKESVDGIRDIIWAIDPKAETMESLLERIRYMAVVACRARDVRFTYVGSGVDRLPPANLVPDVRRHLWLLLKEAVHNALKHSGCKTISLSTSLQDGTLSISVKDDGRGFDSSVVSRGKGLGTMRLRAQEIGSRLDVITQPGGGTSVTLFVKAQNSMN
jgi:ligand-binding sensor domain-containing protein/signal transduction histidine kinase